MKYLLAVLLFICLSSCKNTAQENEKYILGDWLPVKSYNSVRPSEAFDSTNRQAFSFKAGHTVVDKYGYFKRGIGPNESTIYLGNHSKYQINDKNLMIFDLGRNKWITYNIIKLTNNTLVLNDDHDYTFTFEHYKAPKFPIDQFDKISFSTIGCLGGCPMMNIIIDNNGGMVFRGDMYTSRHGLFTANLTKQQCQEIRDLFSLVDIENLKPHYHSSRFDGQSMIITFTKNNKIIKTVTDYDWSSPYQLIWTYRPLQYLYQQVDLKPIVSPTTFSNFWFLMDTEFSKKDSVLKFRNSETSLLLEYLRKGNVCKVNFPARFKFKIDDGKKRPEFITTDGRYYKLTNANKTETIDIGFNFYDVNAQNWRWEKSSKN